MDHTEISKPMRFGVRLMLAWAISGFPLTWHFAYAQGLPNEQPTRAQIEYSAGRGKEFSTQDEATANTLINKRAARLLRSQADGVPVRSPKLMEDTAPVRVPKVVADPDDAASAARAAARIPTRSQQDMVSGAQRGSAIGQSHYTELDAANKTGVATTAEPGQTQTSKDRVNFTEVMPGFNQSEVNRLNDVGSILYNNPAAMKTVAEQKRRNLRRDGCRKTDFMLIQRQNIAQAPASVEHRILKVEFFDLIKQPIPGTNPVEYQTITQPSTYKAGTVNLSVETIGGSSTVWWDRIGDSYAIRYTYTPYTSPKGRNFFTYNHQLAVVNGGALQPLPSNYVVSYGTPNDGFKPVTGYSVPMGVGAVYLSADLYRTDVNYFEPPAEGVPCNPDPPTVCEVPSLGGGDLLRWCPGSQGSNVVLMYDDQNNPDDRRVGKKYNDTVALNASRKDYSGDSQVTAGVIRGLNAPNSDKAKELVGSCRRDTVSRIEVDQGKPYGVPDVNLCSETLINPYPNGCKNIKRSFGLSYVGEHNFLTVKAFTKVKVPIIDPQTGKQIKDTDGNPLFTYRKDPSNVSGAVRTDFGIMGAPTCPGNINCSTEKTPDDPLGGSEGYYVEYIHTPMGGDAKTFAFDGIYVQAGGAGNFTNYGKPSEDWKPTGAANGNGTLHELRLMAKAYSVPINQFAGCEKYMQYVADGFCRGGKLTCVDTSATRTVGGVTFGPGLPNSGIVELLKKWGTESTAVFPDYEGGDSPDPTPTGAPLVMLADTMCWEAQGETFSSCSTMQDEGTLKRFFKGEELWGTDCHIAPDPEGAPLDTSPICKRTPANDGCDSRFQGLYTGVCYNPTVAYDCGKTTNSKLPVVVEEQGDACSGAMRCLGTECHRPNLAGSHGGDFARAVSGMEAINAMVNTMVCAETGEPPKSASEACTPMVFGGKAMYCKEPIGHQIGITPNCCREARKASGGAGTPTWIDYLMATHSLYKITRDKVFKQFMSNSDAYNATANTFGEMAKPFTDAYEAASGWLTESVVKPFQSGFDNIFSSFGSGGSAVSPPVGTGVDSPFKLGNISKVIDGFQQTLMYACKDILVKIGGQELAGMVFQVDAVTNRISFTPGMENVMLALQIYSFVRLIGHIIFACKKEEYEWGMNDRWRLCTFVDSCCAKKALFVCIEKRQLYCCYKSIAARVISEQIVKKGLVPTRPSGYRTGVNGEQLKKCNINCGGFTALELSTIDWSQVDLTEWLDSLVEGGMFNPADPRTNFGVSQNRLESTMAIGRAPDKDGLYDQRIPAVKTAEGWQQNADQITGFTETLRQEGDHCYVDDKKMPFTYPGCKKTVP